MLIVASGNHARRHGGGQYWGKLELGKIGECAALPNSELGKIGKPNKLIQKQFFSQYCNLWGFGTTGMGGNTFCIFIDPGSPIFCLTE